MSQKNLLDEIISRTHLPDEKIREELTLLLKEAGFNTTNPTLDEIRIALSLYLNEIFESIIEDQKETNLPLCI